MDYFDISDDIQDYLYKNGHLYTESKIDRIIDRVDNTLEKMQDWIDDKTDKIKYSTPIHPDKKAEKFDELIEKFEERFDSIFSDWEINYALNREKALRIFHSEIAEQKEDYLKNDYKEDLESYLEEQEYKKQEAEKKKYLKALKKKIFNQLKEAKEIKQAEYIKRFSKEEQSDVRRCIKELIAAGEIVSGRSAPTKTSGPVFLRFPDTEAERQEAKEQAPATIENKRIERIKAWLVPFIESNLPVDIVYMGGTRPGTPRTVYPLKADKSYLYTLPEPDESTTIEEAIKELTDDSYLITYRLEKIRKPENSSKELQNALGVVADLEYISLKELRKGIKKLVEKANCLIGKKTNALGIFEKDEKGTPQKAPFLSIHVSEKSGENTNNRPWTVRGRNINTRAFKDFPQAAHFFATQCMNELFNKP